MDKVSAVAGLIVVGKPSSSAADAVTLVVVEPFFKPFADTVQEKTCRPCHVLFRGAIVECDSNLTICSEHRLGGDRTFEECVVRIVGDLFQAERHEKVPDAESPQVRDFVQRKVGIFDLRSQDA